MSATELMLSLLILMLIGAAWWASSRIREHAQVVVSRTCEHQEVQLLDGTVALVRMRLVRTGPALFSLERTYAFDYTADGARRDSGTVVFRGERPVSVVMGRGPGDRAG